MNSVPVPIAGPSSCGHFDLMFSDSKSTFHSLQDIAISLDSLNSAGFCLLDICLYSLTGLEIDYLLAIHSHRYILHPITVLLGSLGSDSLGWCVAIEHCRFRQSIAAGYSGIDPCWCITLDPLHSTAPDLVHEPPGFHHRILPGSNRLLYLHLLNGQQPGHFTQAYHCFTSCCC